MHHCVLGRSDCYCDGGSMSNVLPGHALRNEGRVFWDEHGDRVAPLAIWTPSTGSAICECGATSPVLDSDRARQRWHREHKDEMRRVEQ